MWIPAVAAGIAAIESLHHFDATAARLAGANSSLTQLKNLRIWWQSLSLTQQSLPHNKQELVEVTEDALQAELAAWTSGAITGRPGFSAVFFPVPASFCFVLSMCGYMRKTPFFSQLFLSLSRACLGKKIVLYTNGVFRMHARLLVPTSLPIPIALFCCSFVATD
eukprot:COSAG06_NODE_1106_length_10684_cov_5.383656_7_plen_165_part_00